MVDTVDTLERGRLRLNLDMAIMVDSMEDTMVDTVDTLERGRLRLNLDMAIMVDSMEDTMVDTVDTLERGRLRLSPARAILAMGDMAIGMPWLWRWLIKLILSFCLS